MNQVHRDLQQLGGSALMTEWGQGCSPFDQTNPQTEECNGVMKVADDHLTGWTEWYFGGHMNDQWRDHGIWDNANAVAISTFARTYATKIAGIPRSMSFDTTTKAFSLCFDPHGTPESFSEENVLQRETVIYANFDVHYSAGMEIQLSDNLELLSSTAVENTIVIRNKVAATAGPRSASCVNIKAM
jgi:hypothetical protein